MVHLVSAGSTFHAQVLCARLGAEGILCELRGSTGGIYPLPGAVEVFVPATDVDDAREVLIADAVDAAFTDAAFTEPPFLGGAASLSGVDPGALVHPADLPRPGALRTRRAASARWRIVRLCLVAAMALAALATLVRIA